MNGRADTQQRWTFLLLAGPYFAILKQAYKLAQDKTAREGPAALEGVLLHYLVEEWKVEQGNSFIAQEGGLNFSQPLWWCLVALTNFLYFHHICCHTVYHVNLMHSMYDDWQFHLLVVPNANAGYSKHQDPTRTS